MRNGSSTERICPNATVHHKSHITWPGIESGPPWWEDGD
jgi:hypothetical protein